MAGKIDDLLPKELGDLRKIALRLEELTDINSDEIAEDVGDLRRIANALEKQAEIDSTEIPEDVGDLERIANAVDELELGGGGSSLTPILKLTLTADSRSYTAPQYCIVDGHVMADEFQILAGATVDILIHNLSGNFEYLLSESGSSAYQLTDLVNCTLFEDEGAIGLAITDPSQNASATLKIGSDIS